MGSLTSRPSVPRAPEPVIIEVPTPVQSPAPSSSSNASSDSPANTSSGGGSPGAGGSPDPEDRAADEARRSTARTENLLSRSRGRLGTVLTGFRGFLSESAAPSDRQVSGRKSLLGE